MTISMSCYIIFVFVYLIVTSSSFTHLARPGNFLGNRCESDALSRARCIGMKGESSSTTVMRMSASSTDGSVSNDNNDLLMRISFVSKEGTETSEAEAIELVQAYVASFPFSAVLPVQPLTYIPRKDGNGVDLSFLRKKTQEKGSIDGGLKFIISSSGADDGTIMLKAIRDSEGQTVSKIFSEGLIIKSFVAGLLDEEGGRVGIGKDELLSKIEVKEFAHKWMM